MKTICQRERLHHALQVVGAVVGGATTKPVLQDIKLEAGEDSLGLVATDLEVGVRYRLPDVEVLQAGAALIPVRTLTDIVRNSTDETLELEWAERSLVVRGRNSRFRILGQDPEEFPGLPEVEEAGSARIGGDILSAMIRSTVYAVSEQSTRYALNGIYWEVDGKKFNMTATDGHRLAHIERSLEAPAAAPARGIVPRKAALILERSVGPEDEVAFRLGDNDILARTERVTIYARLLEGTFPRYREVIPTSHPSRLEARARELDLCVRQAAVLTSDESRAVRFHIEPGHLTLRARTPEAGEAQVELAVEYQGEPLVIGFNPKFLADALNPVTEETVQLEFATPEQPGVLRDGKGYVCVLMPLTLAEEASPAEGEEGAPPDEEPPPEEVQDEEEEEEEPEE